MLFVNIGPYHQARLAALERAVDVLAVEYARKDETYPWTVSDPPGIALYQVPPSYATRLCSLRRRVEEVLTGWCPTLVAVPGWSEPVALAALDWCVTHSVPAVLMSDSTEHDKVRMAAVERLKSRLLSLYSAALAAGTPHRDYLVTLGMPESSIFLGYDAVDNAHFAAGAASARARSESPPGIPAPAGRFFLACARFVAKKNLAGLIAAYGRYRTRAGSRAWDLVIVGDGPLRDDLAGRIERAGLTTAVHLPGFLDYADLPAFYGTAGAFVHASTSEQWGLVVNEAMASGLAVLVSDRCGCAADLVRDGENGFTFDPDDGDALAGLMYRVAHGGVDRAAMGAASQRIIADWDLDRFADGMVTACARAIAAGSNRASMMQRLLLRGLMYR